MPQHTCDNPATRPFVLTVATGLVFGLPFALAACSTPAQEPIRRIAQVTHPPLAEISGITRSSHAGLYWVHNDSGDAPRIFAIRLDGRPAIPPNQRERYAKEPWPGLTVDGAKHVDWEDITFNGGRLYIAETGNNRNARRDLGIYVLAEPNPTQATRARIEQFLPVRYPDQQQYPARQWHFDCEGLFVADDKLYLLSKHRERNKELSAPLGTKLYRLDTRHTDRDNVLTLLGSRSDIGQVTGADMSPDGKRLAVLTYRGVWVFDRPEQGDNWLTGRARRLEFDGSMTQQIEAITWKNAKTLVAVNEQRDVFAIDVAALTPVE